MSCLQVCEHAHVFAASCVLALQTPILDFVAAWWLCITLAVAAKFGLAALTKMASGTDQRYILLTSAVEFALLLPFTPLSLPMLCSCGRAGVSHEAPGLLTSGAWHCSPPSGGKGCQCCVLLVVLVLCTCVPSCVCVGAPTYPPPPSPVTSVCSSLFAVVVCVAARRPVSVLLF